MNWLIGLILPYVFDAVFAALMKVLKDLVTQSSSDVDNRLVDTLAKEQEPIKKLVMDQARKRVK